MSRQPNPKGQGAGPPPGMAPPGPPPLVKPNVIVTAGSPLRATGPGRSISPKAPSGGPTSFAYNVPPPNMVAPPPPPLPLPPSGIATPGPPPGRPAVRPADVDLQIPLPPRSTPKQAAPSALRRPSSNAQQQPPGYLNPLHSSATSIYASTGSPLPPSVLDTPPPPKKQTQFDKDAQQHYESAPDRAQRRQSRSPTHGGYSGSGSGSDRDRDRTLSSRAASRGEDDVSPPRSAASRSNSGNYDKDGKRIFRGRTLTHSSSAGSAQSFVTAPKHSEYTESTVTEERKWDANCMWNVGLLLVAVGLCVFGGSMFVQKNGAITNNIEWEVRSRIIFYDDVKGSLYDDFVWNNYNYPNTAHHYYLFHCNNPSAVLKGGTPALTQMGPYTFEEKSYRTAVTFSDSGDSVTYSTLAYQHFVVDEGYYYLLDDEITMINQHYVRALYNAKGHDLVGIDYLLAEGTAQALSQIKQFYTSSTGTTFTGKVGDLHGKQYSLPDRLWRHFFPHALKELYNELHASSSAGSMGVDTFEGFTARWGGYCDRGGCLSSSTNPFNDKELYTLMNPGFCESYTQYTLQKCDIGFSKVVPEEFSRQLWLASDPFSFVSNSVKKDGELLGIYLWMDESDSARRRLLSYYTFLTEEQYYVIRTWLLKMADSDRVNNKILALYGTFVGQSVSDPKKSHKNAALYQFGTGKILSEGNANFASYNDTMAYSSSAYALDDGFQIGSWVYSNGPACSEFAVWALRKKGLRVALSTSESLALLSFLGTSNDDTTGFWSLRQGAVSNPSAALPGVPSVTYQLASEYVKYISDTFVLPAFVKYFAGEGALMATRKASQWIQWFNEPVNEWTMQAGDPRLLSGLAASRNETVLLPTDPEFDMQEWEANDADKRVECWSSAFRRVVVSDESNAVVFDPCEFDSVSDMWLTKPRTVSTGRSETSQKGVIEKFAGYESLPKELWGSELSFSTAARQLLGPNASPTQGMTDGLNFPPLNRLGHSCSGKSCKVAVLHEDTTVPLIFRVLDNVKDYRKLGVKRMTLDDHYFGGEGDSPYHTDFTMVNTDYPGMLDISSAMGVPMFLSRPHFHTNDAQVTESYTNKIMGLKPSAHDHESVIEVEYATGICANSQLKLQYNILLPPLAGIFGAAGEGELEGASIPAGEDAIVYPLYWHHVDRQLTQSDVDDLAMEPVYALYWMETTLVGSSVMFTLIMIGVGIFLLRRGHYMHYNPSNRLNVAGLRYHQQQAELNTARLAEEEKEMESQEKRAQLEMRIKSVVPS